MNRILAALTITVLGSLTLAPARAVPPTVTPSPGYDARLQESRSASTIYTPAPRPRPTSAKRFRRGQ
jgi:hypothetical protein